MDVRFHLDTKGGEAQEVLSSPRGLVVQVLEGGLKPTGSSLVVLAGMVVAGPSGLPEYRIGDKARLFAIEILEDAPFSQLVLADHGKPIHTCAKLRSELKSPDAFSDDIVRGLTLELVGYLRRLSDAQERSKARPEWLLRSINWTLQNLDRSLTLEEAAAAVDMKPRRFAREFRQWVGHSFGEFTRRKRIDAATRELILGQKTLGEIAHENGFADQAHFSREFKKLVGVPPSQYAEAIRSNAG